MDTKKHLNRGAFSIMTESEIIQSEYTSLANLSASYANPYSATCREWFNRASLGHRI